MQYTMQTLVVAALAGLALTADVCKHHANTNPSPSGNPIHQPEKGFPVPAGKPFQITWTPTTTNPISIVLLRGPADHAEEYQCIVDSTTNSGSYSWAVPSTLDADKSNYGLKIIDDITGDYQYSDLFGISNNNKQSSSSSPAASSKTTTKGEKTSATNTPHTKPTTFPAGNSTIPYPTGSASASSTIKTSTKSSSSESAGNKTLTASPSTSTFVPSADASAGAPGQETSVAVVSEGGVGGGEATATETAGGETSAPAVQTGAASALLANSGVWGVVAAVGLWAL